LFINILQINNLNNLIIKSGDIELSKFASTKERLSKWTYAHLISTPTPYWQENTIYLTATPVRWPMTIISRYSMMFCHQDMSSVKCLWYSDTASPFKRSHIIISWADEAKIWHTHTDGFEMNQTVFHHLLCQSKWSLTAYLTFVGAQKLVCQALVVYTTRCSVLIVAHFSCATDLLIPGLPYWIHG